MIENLGSVPALRDPKSGPLTRKKCQTAEAVWHLKIFLNGIRDNARNRRHRN